MVLNEGDPRFLSAGTARIADPAQAVAEMPKQSTEGSRRRLPSAGRVGVWEVRISEGRRRGRSWRCR
jgi:hypothetical protein